MKPCSSCQRAMALVTSPDGQQWHYCLHCNRPTGDRL